MMAEVCPKYKLQDLIDLKRFQALQDRLNEIYSFPSAIIDNEGNVLTATAWQDICTQFHRKDPDSNRHCIESDKYILGHLHEAKPWVSYRCPHGLVDNATPIIIDGVHYGNFFTGQFFLQKPDLEFFKAQARRYGFEEVAYLTAVKTVPVWTEQQLESYLQFIKELIAIISESGLRNLKEIEARKKIEESEERATTILHQMHEGFCITRSSDRQIVDVNDVMCRLIGYSREELLGMSITDLELSDAVQIAQWRQQLLASGSADFETCLRHKSGALVYVELSLSYLSKRELVFGFLRDITERKRMEEEVQKSQKLESLGVLAGGIAHDFNNLLGGIFGYIDMAADLSSDAEVATHLSKALSTIDRARGLTSQLLTFAKGGAPIRSVEPLFPFVQETAQFALSGSNVSAKVTVPDGLWPCYFDRNQIGQVIDNIIINAAEAMPSGGTVELTAQNTILEECEHPSLGPGHYVKMSIRDHGEGIPRELQSRIFDPFFTTKAKGHGLGLATSYSIISRHGGCIEVESAPGAGSTFHIYLPATTEAVLANGVQAVTAFRGDGIFVVMDDEEVMRETMKRMLESFGFTVVLTSNGSAAVDFFRAEIKAQRKVAGMIFDLTIPGGMGGREAIGEVRKLCAATPVFVASGYAEDPVMADPKSYGFSASICKPFRKADLARLLAESFQS